MPLHPAWGCWYFQVAVACGFYTVQSDYESPPPNMCASTTRRPVSSHPGQCPAGEWGQSCCCWLFQRYQCVPAAVTSTRGILMWYRLPCPPICCSTNLLLHDPPSLPTFLQLTGRCLTSGTGASVNPANWKVQLVLCGVESCQNGINLPSGYQAAFPTCVNVTGGPSCTLPAGALPVDRCGSSVAI